MAQKVNVTTYLRNVGKSFGYAIGDAFSDYNPVLKDLTKEATDNAKDLYSSIKDFVFEKPSMDEKSFKGTVKNTFSDIINNIKEDVSTGNFYNKQRQEAFNDDMMKALGMDLGDWDFDFDDEDWGDDFDSDEDSSDSKMIAQSNEISNEKSAKQIVAGLDVVGGKISGAIGEATVKSAEYVAESNNRAAKALYDMSQRGFGQVTAGLVSVNNSIAAFAKIGEPLTAHMQNAAVFYTKTTEKLDHFDQMLKEIATNTKPAPSALNNNVKYGKNGLGSLIDDGGISIYAFKNMIKEQFDDNKDLIDGALDMVKKFKSEDGSYGKSLSLAQAGSVWFTKLMIPKMFKESMKGFNESLKYSLQAGLLKLKNSSIGDGNLFTSILKDMLLPQDNFKRKINTGNYNKGPIQWDGVAKMALTHVIPQYLAQITAAVTGQDPEYYSYESGKFVRGGAIIQKRDKNEIEYAKRAGGDFREDILKNIDKNANDNSKEQLSREVEEFFFTAFIKGGDLSDLFKSGFNYKSYGLSKEAYEYIKKTYGNYYKSSDRTKRSRATQYLVNNQLTRDEYGDNRRREEASGISDEIWISNGFGEKRKGNKLVDEYGHGMAFYIQGIYEYTGYIANNLHMIGGSRKGKKWKSAPNLKGGLVLPHMQMESSSGETTKEDYNKIFYNDYEDDDPESIREKNSKEDKEEAMKGLSKGAKGIKEKLTSFIKLAPGKAKDLYERPFNAVSTLLDSLTVSMNKLIWGKDESGEDGLFSLLYNKTKSAMDKFNDWMDDKFGWNPKDKAKKAWDYLWGEKDPETGKRTGGKFKEFREDLGENLKSAGRWAGETIRKPFRSGKTNNGNAAYGRKVTKSGIVTVSEGEMIIPAEYNPFYHGTVNKASQINNENRISQGYLGNFANGNPEVEFGEGSAHKFIREGFESLGGGFSKFFKGVLGLGGKDDDEEKEKKTLSKVTGNILKEMGLNKGAMGAGALIGGGVSLLTGAVVGPIFGAAIGAGVGLLTKSKKFQHVVFGVDEETGEINGGLLNKEISQAIIKTAPNMAKGGILGGLGGLFLGSPVLGAFAGSAIGFAASSDKFKNWLFGSIDEDGNRKDGAIPKEIQDYVKKATPNIAAGMLAGAFIGPFGMVGNLAVGAGLGLVTSSSKFHDFMFGDGDNPGLTQKIHDKVFVHIDDLFHNMGNAFSGWFKNFSKKLSNKINDALKGLFGKAKDKFANTFLGRAIGGAGRKIGGAVSGLVSGAGIALRGLSNRRKSKNLAKGYNVYDNSLGRNMSAMERSRMREEMGVSGGTFGAFDQVLAGASSIEELNKLEQALKAAEDPKRARRLGIGNAVNGLYSGLEGLGAKDVNKIASLVGKGKTDQAIKIVQSANLSDAQKSEYIQKINDAAQKVGEANNAANSSKETLANWKAKGIDLTKSSNMTNALDLIKQEKKDARFNKDPETTFRDRIIQLLSSINKSLATTNNTDPETGESEAGSNDNQGDVSYYNDFLGGVHKRTVNNQGDPEDVTNDSETKKANERINGFMKDVSSAGKVGAAINGLTGLVGSFKDKLLGNDEKEGLLSKIFGKDGYLGGIFSFITNSKPGQMIKSILSKVTLKSVFAELIGPALLAAGFAGKFDDLASKLSGGSMSSESTSKTEIYYDKNTGEKLTKDENGNYVDSQGNIVDTGDVNLGVRQGGLMSLSDRLKYNTARGVLTNTKTVAGTVLGRTKLGSKIASGASKLTSGFSKAAYSFMTGDAWKISKLEGEGASKMTDIMKTKVATVSDEAAETIANKAMRSSVAGQVDDAISGLIKGLKKVPVLKNVDLDGMGAKLSEKISTTVVSSGGKTLASIGETLATATVVLKVALVAADFVTGYEDARTTLGITGKPTTGQKILSGLLRAIKNCIPIVGTLIPDSMVVDVCCDFVAPALGIDAGELKKQRSDAKEEVNAYNQEHGTNYSVGEYNKAVLQDYTFTERIGNAAKGTWTDAKNKVKSVKNGIKEKGVKGYLKDSLTSMGTNFINQYKEAGGGVSGVVEGLGSTFQKLLPGVFGDIAKAKADIIADANDGKIADMWKVSLPNFSQGKNDEGIETAVPSLFSRAIGQVPLLISKITYTPLSLLKAAVNKLGIVDAISNTVDKIKQANDYMVQQQKYGEKLIHDPDSHLSDYFKIDNAPDGAFGAMFKAATIGSRLFGIPIAIVKKLGNSASNKFSEIINKAKGTISEITTNTDQLGSYMKSGDLASFVGFKYKDEEGNPMKFIPSIATFGYQILHLIPAVGSWMGHKAYNSFKSNIVEPVKNDYGKAKDVIKNIFSSKDGEKKTFSDIINENAKFESPLSGVFNVFFTGTKLIAGLVNALKSLLEPVAEWIDGVKDTIGDTVDGVKDTVGGAKDAVVNTATNIGKGIANKADNVYQGVKNWVTGGGSGVKDPNTGNSNNFVSQLDKRYKDKKFGKSTVGELGCAPAVATMLSKKYGKNLSMNQAISAAQGKYQTDVGTTADYFSNVLNKQGIQTSYLNGKNVSKDTLQALQNGNSVILLGRDGENQTKKDSPFGPKGHYVLATGIDSNGNIIINDPENDRPTTYPRSILNNINLGVATGVAGGDSYDTSTAKKVWGWLTSHGYSESAAAGIMGNMYQESGVNPKAIQGNGKGPAAGIVQWEKYKSNGTRWGNMAEYAKSKGKDWTDLTSQLEYMNKELSSNDIDQRMQGKIAPSNMSNAGAKTTTFENFKKSKDALMAMRQFEGAFERAGTPNFPRREEATKAFYKLYTGSEYTGNYTDDGTSSADSTGDNSSTSNSGGILSAIATAFTTGLGKLFGENTGDSSSSGLSSSDDGEISGDLPSGKGNDGQKKIVKYALSRLGKNQYTQGPNRTKVGEGYSDCSAFAEWCYKKAIDFDPGSWTGAQIENKDMKIVDKGSSPNIDKLEAGDLMFWKSQGSNNVGHVEIYDGNGNTIGHGSGIGPKKRTVEEYTKIRNNYGGPYAYSMRYKDIAKFGGSTVKGGSSIAEDEKNKTIKRRLKNNNIAAEEKKKGKKKLSGGSSGLLLNSNFGESYIGGGSKVSKSNKIGKSFIRGSYSSTDGTVSKEEVKNIVTQYSKSGQISVELVEALVEALINVLNSISMNTAPISKIYDVLNQYLGNKDNSSTNTSTNKTKTTNTKKKTEDIDSNIVQLVGTLAALAKG